MPVVPPFEPGAPLAIALSPPAALAVVAGLTAVGLMALLRQRPRFGGTTLVAVCGWELACLATIAVTELSVAALAADATESWVLPVRLIAATSSLLPTMALLGAKRPQDRAWQWIVGTLWCILSLPAAHWLLFGGVHEMHPAQLVFLAILVGVGLVNGLATRQWLASVLFAAGQVALLSPFLAAQFGWDVGPAISLVGLALLVAAWLTRGALRPRALTSAAPLDRVWLDFRDAFGAVWGVRIMERMNAASTMYGWPLVLTWSGFRPRAEADVVGDVPNLVEESLRTLLRRFVSSEWIDARLQSDVCPAAPTISAA